MIEPLESVEVLWSTCLYVPEVPIVLSECTVVEGSIRVCPPITSQSSSYSSYEDANSSSLVSSWFTDAEKTDGIYSRAQDANHVGFNIDINGETAQVLVHTGSGSNGQTNGAATVDLVEEHSVSFRFVVGQGTMFFLNGVNFGNVITSNRRSNISNLVHLFVVTAGMYPDANIGETATWNDGEWLAETYKAGFPFKDITLRAC